MNSNESNLDKHDKKSGIIYSFDENNKNQKNERYHVKFVDEMAGESKQLIAKTYVVESYKKYNATTWWERCCCSIF